MFHFYTLCCMVYGAENCEFFYLLLREIKFGDLEVSRTVIKTFIQALDFNNFLRVDLCWNKPL